MQDEEFKAFYKAGNVFERDPQYYEQRLSPNNRTRNERSFSRSKYGSRITSRANSRLTENYRIGSSTVNDKDSLIKENENLKSIYSSLL